MRGRERARERVSERDREGERDLPWIAMTVMNTFSAAVVRISLGKIGVAGTHVTRSGKIDRFIDKNIFLLLQKRSRLNCWTLFQLSLHSQTR